ncbi:MAG: amino acid permease [Collinsella sp.]
MIIASETPFEAARRGSFPLAFAKTNKAGAPVVTVLVSSSITQLFLILSAVASSTYQFFYTCAVNTILIPYVCSAAYYMVIGWKKEHLDSPHAPSVRTARIFGTLGFIYTLFLVWSTRFAGRHDHDDPVRSGYRCVCNRRARPWQAGPPAHERQSHRRRSGDLGNRLAVPALLGDFTHRVAASWYLCAPGPNGTFPPLGPLPFAKGGETLGQHWATLGHMACGTPRMSRFDLNRL